MKQYLLICLTIISFISCRDDQSMIPDENELLQYRSMDVWNIKASIEKQSMEGQKVQISAFYSSIEQFELYRYLIPVLHDLDQGTIDFWFLRGNSDEDLNAFLNDEPSALSASELLFNTHPYYCGFKVYEDFLNYLKNFNTQNPGSIQLINNDDAFLKVDRTMTESDRSHYLVHSPWILDDGSTFLPENGHFYYMMIHEWSLNHYSVLDIAERDYDYLILLSYPEQNPVFESIEDQIREDNIEKALSFYPKQIIREKTKPATYLLNKKLDRQRRKIRNKLDKAYVDIRSLEPARQE